jgi:hypothetical protein
MIAGCRVGPFAGCALARFGSFQPDEQERPGAFLTSPTSQ